MNSSDKIEIRRLLVPTFIGVPDEERANQQTVYVTVVMTPSKDFSDLHDDIQNTIDYYQASLGILEIGMLKPRHLIETLAVEIADYLLASYPILETSVTIEKQILPNTDFVAVSITRNLPHLNTPTPRL